MESRRLSGSVPAQRAPVWWQDWGNALPVLAIAYCLTYVIWKASGPKDDLATHIIARLVFLPLNAGTALVAWRAARRHAHDPRTQRALRIITVAFICVLAGNIVSFYVGMIMDGDPGVSWINVFYFPFYPLLLTGLLSFPLTRRSEHENRKFLLDAAAVLVGGGTAIWFFVVRPTTQANALGPLASAISLAYPLGDILLLTGLTTFLMRRPPESRGGARNWFVFAVTAYAISDLANDLEFLTAGWFGLTSTDVGFLGAYCVFIASLARFQWPPPAVDAQAEQKLPEVQPFSPLPYVSGAFLFGLILVVAIRAWPTPLSVLSIGAMCTTAFLVVRQLAAVGENARLVGERAARENEARFRALVQHSTDVIAIVDVDGVIRFLSPSVTRIFGYVPEDLLGRKVTDFLHHESARDAVSLLVSAAANPGATAPAEWKMRHRDGRLLSVETVGTNLLAEPTVGGIVLNTRDISERKALEKQLTHQAFHDPLTGLANRVLFLDRVSHALSLVRRHDQMLAVLFVDLDGFKTINDSLGHAAGDRLLAVVAQRLQTCVRTSDTVARLGGDEFALLIEDATDDHAASEVADRIAASVRHPILIEGKEVFMTASIGIATAKDEGSASDLLRNADMAMYVAKSHGKARWERFEPGMHTKALERLDLEAELRHALDGGDQFALLYQPIVQLQTGEVKGIEALVRWNHPQRGTLTPAQFIPLAEETGLIVSLGRWVLREACRQAQVWQATRTGGAPLTLTVNVSGYQLQYDGVVADVRAALADSGLDPRNLVLEITESVLMQQNETILERLRALKAVGVRLAIDDFGTGYSSLGYLQRFPIDILKIDKAFVDDIGAAGAEPALVRAIIALGDTLQLQTIAEGIELRQQWHGLRELGCEMGQGFLFARPVGVVQIDALLAGKGVRAPAALLPADTPAPQTAG